MNRKVVKGVDEDDQKQMVEVFKSPITSPTLLPEVFNIIKLNKFNRDGTAQLISHYSKFCVLQTWDKILRDLPPKDFQAAINTCPEWNHLMSSSKTTKLLPLVNH